jgi:DDE superfamily endonuclease
VTRAFGEAPVPFSLPHPALQGRATLSRPSGAKTGSTLLRMAVVWDNAAWHNSRRGRDWIRAHNRRVKREGGVRLVVCALPAMSPWLNRLEPYWVHGKRAILKVERKLTVAETIERLCAYFGYEPFPPLTQQLN